MKRFSTSILAAATAVALLSLPATSGSFAASDTAPKPAADNAEQGGPCGPGQGRGWGRRMGQGGGMGRGMGGVCLCCCEETT